MNSIYVVLRPFWLISIKLSSAICRGFRIFRLPWGCMILSPFCWRYLLRSPSGSLPPFVTIKHSKTDPLRQGVIMVLGRTFSQLCPVAAMASYLATCGFGAGPLFQLSDRTPLSRNWFMKQVHSALTTIGLDHSVFNGHSFQIGAATAAA